jgi:hypothetical protein
MTRETVFAGGQKVNNMVVTHLERQGLISGYDFKTGRVLNFYKSSKFEDAKGRKFEIREVRNQENTMVDSYLVQV